MSTTDDTMTPAEAGARDGRWAAERGTAYTREQIAAAAEHPLGNADYWNAYIAALVVAEVKANPDGVAAQMVNGLLAQRAAAVDEDVEPCADCGHPVRYDDARGVYLHTEPGVTCFLHGSIDGTPGCPGCTDDHADGLCCRCGSHQHDIGNRS